MMTELVKKLIFERSIIRTFEHPTMSETRCLRALVQVLTENRTPVAKYTFPENAIEQCTSRSFVVKICEQHNSIIYPEANHFSCIVCDAVVIVCSKTLTNKEDFIYDYRLRRNESFECACGDVYSICEECLAANPNRIDFSLEEIVFECDECAEHFCKTCRVFVRCRSCGDGQQVLCEFCYDNAPAECCDDPDRQIVEEPSELDDAS